MIRERAVLFVAGMFILLWVLTGCAKDLGLAVAAWRYALGG